MDHPDQELSSLSAGVEQSLSEADPANTEPFPPSEQSPENSQHDPILSPLLSSFNPLPAKLVGDSDLQSTMNQSNSAQPKSRIVGGFEIDDDPEDEEGTQDGKDEVDVYDPSMGMDFDAPTPADTPANHMPTSLDRTSQSPEQENGNSPAPVQATGSPPDADISSSTVPGASSDMHAPRAANATPSHVVPDPSTQTSPPLPHVNGSDVPGFPKSRLAHDVVGILEDRIRDDPRGDTDAYLALIDEFKNRNKQEDVRRVYEDYLKVFPFAVRAFQPLSMTNDTDKVNRLINGAPTSNLKKNMTACAQWKPSSTGHCSKSLMYHCGLCTSTTSAGETACRQVTLLGHMESSMIPSPLR
jgi:cleavage stimulation factor subunit 3